MPVLAHKKREPRKPSAPNAQTALVVGLDGEVLTTYRDHRVKVQFAWQRGLQPNAGGLGHTSTSDAKGNASGNEQSGTWVRVAQPAAGANWGAVYTPRIGTEVAIGFVEGDIDRPIVLGALYNGVDTPPRSVHRVLADRMAHQSPSQSQTPLIDNHASSTVAGLPHEPRHPARSRLRSLALRSRSLVLG